MQVLDILVSVLILDLRKLSCSTHIMVLRLCENHICRDVFCRTLEERPIVSVFLTDSLKAFYMFSQSTPSIFTFGKIFTSAED